MKRIALLIAVCVALSPACLAESSSADRFLSSLSDTWDAFLDLAGDAGQSVSEWAEESGVTEWVDGAVGSVTAWADEIGLTAWAQGAIDDISAWADESGFTEMAQGIAADTRALIEKNRPAVEAWLAQAGEEARQALNTLLNAEEHSEEEVREALETVAGSLEESGATESDAATESDSNP